MDKFSNLLNRFKVKLDDLIPLFLQKNGNVSVSSADKFVATRYKYGIFRLPFRNISEMSKTT
jgi:hypothetical protein